MHPAKKPIRKFGAAILPGREDGNVYTELWKHLQCELVHSVEPLYRNGLHIQPETCTDDAT